MVSFASKGSIHGLNYIFGRNRSISVRIFWSCLFIFSIFGVTHFILIAYVKWQTDPFTIVIKRHIKNIEDYPKFAVTICPEIISSNNSLTHDPMKERYLKEDDEKKAIFNEEECNFIQINSLWCGDFRDLTKNWAKESR